MIKLFKPLFPLFQAPKRRPGGYLLIKRWGAGFWSDVDMLITYLLVAETTKRTPVVNWGTDGPYANGLIDTFELYFEPVSQLKASDLEGSIYPNNWNAGNITKELPFAHKYEIDEKYGSYHLCSEKRQVQTTDRQFKYLRRRREDIVVAYCWEYADRVIAKSNNPNRSVQELRAEMMRTKLTLKAELRKEIELFFENELRGRKVMGIHMRGSDKVRENAVLHSQNENALQIATEWVKRSKNHFVFLATDSTNYANRFKGLLGPEKVIMQDCLRSDEDTPNFLTHSSNGYKNGREIIIDTYIASKCHEFVGNSTSNVANFVAAIGEFKPEELHWVNECLR